MKGWFIYFTSIPYVYIFRFEWVDVRDVWVSFVRWYDNIYELVTVTVDTSNNAFSLYRWWESADIFTPTGTFQSWNQGYDVYVAEVGVLAK